MILVQSFSLLTETLEEMADCNLVQVYPYTVFVYTLFSFSGGEVFSQVQCGVGHVHVTCIMYSAVCVCKISIVHVT